VTRPGALFRHPVSIIGVLITTASAVVFIALAIAAGFGLFENPYAGLVIFVALPAAFVLGLLLMPLGLWLERRRPHDADEADWPVIDFRHASVRRTAVAITALTAVNVTILLVAGYGGLHHMESPAFCGQTCHTPMHPQFTAWQATTHARIACVQCHVGEGARAFVHYKLAGVRQLIHVIDGNYPRPIPASQAKLRPALEICGHCHDPQRNSGDVAYTSSSFADDETNSETKMVFQMFVGGPGHPASNGKAIHWHADPAVRVEYAATDEERETIPYVKVTRPDGTVTEYLADGAAKPSSPDALRVMDCIDCHNAAAHRISPTAEQAVDRAIASGRIDRQLPFVRREAVRLVTAEYPDQDAALAAIERELRQFYSTTGSPAPRVLDGAVASVKDTYRTNVFPVMKVKFGVYRDNLDHFNATACLRCHDDQHKAADGKTISGDCEYCHKQVE